ncbi:MAG: YiaA/YiaB family inner membrane protein [Hyphomicrobiaceae bacterium]
MSSLPVNPAASANTGGWITFTYAQFGVAIFMTALGIWAMPVELIAKGYMMMSSVLLIGSTFTLAKTVRDEHEAKRFASRIEEARTEKLLMEVGRGG